MHCRPPDEIGQGEINGVNGIRKLEQQRVAHLVQRRGFDERQWDIDCALQRAEDVLELAALHLLGCSGCLIQSGTLTTLARFCRFQPASLAWGIA